MATTHNGLSGLPETATDGVRMFSLDWENGIATVVTGISDAEAQGSIIAPLGGEWFVFALDRGRGAFPWSGHMFDARIVEGGR